MGPPLAGITASSPCPALGGILIPDSNFRHGCWEKQISEMGCWMQTCRGMSCRASRSHGSGTVTPVTWAGAALGCHWEFEPGSLQLGAKPDTSPDTQQDEDPPSSPLHVCSVLGFLNEGEGSVEKHPPNPYNPWEGCPNPHNPKLWGVSLSPTAHTWRGVPVSFRIVSQSPESCILRGVPMPTVLHLCVPVPHNPALGSLFDRGKD